MGFLKKWGVGLWGGNGFLCTINSDEHSAKRYVRSVPKQPTAMEWSDEPWAYCISTGQLRENKGGDVMRIGVQ
jgi:hypothetical protein